MVSEFGYFPTIQTGSFEGNLSSLFAKKTRQIPTKAPHVQGYCKQIWRDRLTSVNLFDTLEPAEESWVVHLVPIVHPWTLLPNLSHKERSVTSKIFKVTPPKITIHPLHGIFTYGCLFKSNHSSIGYGRFQFHGVSFWQRVPKPQPPPKVLDEAPLVQPTWSGVVNEKPVEMFILRLETKTWYRA